MTAWCRKRSWGGVSDIQDAVDALKELATRALEPPANYATSEAKTYVRNLVNTVLRGFRTAGPATRGRLHVGSLVVDLDEHKVSVADQLVRLTRIEFELLTALMLQPGKVWSKQGLGLQVWGKETDPHTVVVHMSNLSRKVGRQRIQNVRSYGYRIVGA